MSNYTRNNDVLSSFPGWTFQAYLKGEATLDLKFSPSTEQSSKAKGVLASIFPPINVQLLEIQGVVSTGEQTISVFGETETLYPGIYVYTGSARDAQRIKTVLDAVFGVLEPVLVSQDPYGSILF